MDQFDIFNREVAGLIRNEPRNARMQVIRRYRDSLGKGADYFDALMGIGNHLGLELVCTEVFKRGRSQGYIPQVILREGNPYNGKAGVHTINQCPHKRMKTLYDYMSRQYVYFLIDIRTLEERVFGE